MTHDRPLLAQLCAATKRYGAIPALERVDLSLREGEVVALLGTNGAGKSTAVGLLLGLLRPDAGRVRLLGLAPQALAARRGAGVMLQTAGIPGTLRVGELLQLTRSYYSAPRSVDECVALAGLEGLLGRRYGRLSGGQQRRVQFAMAICGRPRVLFLDEPTSGLDIHAREQVWWAVRELVEQGSAVLLTTHYLEEAEALADRVVMLAAGRVVAEGSLAQIRARVVQQRIRCITALDAAVVAGWPQVRSALRHGDGLEIVASGAEAVVRRLLDEDPRLSALEVRRAGLAEAFLELGRRPLSEAA